VLVFMSAAVSSLNPTWPKAQADAEAVVQVALHQRMKAIERSRPARAAVLLLHQDRL
jgi:hypothetical protein